MVKNIISLIVWLVFVSFSFAQEAIVQKAILENVTVFSRAAELNHKAQVNLPAGSSEIVFTHVASTIDENSIQLGVSSGVSVLSVRSTTNYIEADVKTEGYIKVEKAYKSALHTFKELENKKAAEESMLKLLEQNQKISSSNSGTTVAELAKMTEFYKPKYLEVKNNITALEEEIAEQQDVVNKAKVQFDEFAGQTTGSGGQLIVQVISDKSGSFPFSISYLTPQSNWNASYELRAKDISSPLQIVYKANISQQTGVDWEQVNLRLSTANPSQGGVAPVLSPWHLYYNQMTARALQGRASGIPVRSAALNQEVVEKVARPAALNDAVQQTEHQLNTTFDIDIPYTVVSNGKPHAVNLKAESHSASYRYYVAPSKSSEVFLMAELTDYEKLNLIAGQANVMFENMLVGKTYINPNEATDTLKLSLGRDKMIAVKREKINELSSSKLFGNSKTDMVMYETTIKNNKKTAVQLTVQDQYPLATDKSMEIKLEERNGGKVDPESGIVTWTLNIPAGATHKLKFGYSVKYPKNRSVTIR